MEKKNYREIQENLSALKKEEPFKSTLKIIHDLEGLGIYSENKFNLNGPREEFSKKIPQVVSGSTLSTNFTEKKR